MGVKVISSSLAITNNATVNILFAHFCVLLKVYPRREISRSNGRHVKFLNNCQVLSTHKISTDLCSHQRCRSACFPAPSAALVTTALFNLCQSDRWKIVSSCYFNVHFSNYKWQMFIGHLWRVTAKCLCFSFFVFFLLISKLSCIWWELDFCCHSCWEYIFQFAFFLLTIFMVYFSHVNVSVCYVGNFFIILLLCKVCILYHN